MRFSSASAPTGPAILNRETGLPPWGTIPLGAVCRRAAGLVVGIPCLRLRGTYLALTTLAFPIILLGIIFAFPNLDRRGTGDFRLAAPGAIQDGPPTTSWSS
jgi:ABC-type branched-subunit amino acid transport system permease subunit